MDEKRFHTMTSILQTLRSDGLLPPLPVDDGKNEQWVGGTASASMDAFCNALVRYPGEEVVAALEMHSRSAGLVVSHQEDPLAVPDVVVERKEAGAVLPAFDYLMAELRTDLFGFIARYGPQGRCQRGSLPFETHVRIASSLLADYYRDNVDAQERHTSGASLLRRKDAFQDYMIGMGLRRVSSFSLSSRSVLSFLWGEEAADSHDLESYNEIDCGLSTEKARDKFAFWCGMYIKANLLDEEVAARAVQDIDTAIERGPDTFMPLTPDIARTVRSLLRINVSGLRGEIIGLRNAAWDPADLSEESELIKHAVAWQKLLITLTRDMKPAIFGYVDSVPPTTSDNQQIPKIDEDDDDADSARDSGDREMEPGFANDNDVGIEDRVLADAEELRDRWGDNREDKILHFLRRLTINATSSVNLTPDAATPGRVDELMNILSKATVEVYDVQQPEVEMEPWRETLEAVLEDPESKDELVRNLETVFTRSPTPEPGDIFRRKTKQVFPYHCQISFACRIAEVKTRDIIFTDHARVFNKFARVRECKIGISRPCCGICLCVLKLLGPTIRIQARESTYANDYRFRTRPLDHIYRCALPPECPEDVMHHAYTYLSTQFKYLLKSAEFRARLQRAVGDGDAPAAELDMVSESMDLATASTGSRETDETAGGGIKYSDGYVAEVIQRYLDRMREQEAN